MSRDLARKLRRNLTDAERKLWRSLRGRHFAGFKFRRQQPLGPYVADFVCLERRLVIEADGGEHAERAGRDAERTRWLAAQGYRVMRFWNHQVLGETEAVLAAIREALGEHPSPQPSPSRGEGGNRDWRASSPQPSPSRGEGGNRDWRASSPQPSPSRGEGGASAKALRGIRGQRTDEE